jgi:transcriptional regulator with XRE-family HTH domain
MSQAQSIIEKLKEKGMSYAAIGAAIGTSRESISRIAHGQQSGDRSLVKLQKLAIATGVSTPVPSVQSSVPDRTEPDVAPLTEEELRYQEEWDRYAEWQELQPVAHRVGEVIKGTRGKLVESLLPEGYSVVKTPTGTSARVVESTPQPPQPKGQPYWGSAPHPHRKRQRKPRYQLSQVEKNYSTRLEHHPILLGLGLILSLFMPRQPSTPVYHQLPISPLHSDIPRYVPTFQYRETQEYITLSTPHTPHVNTMGYAPQTIGEPIQPQPYFGRIPTDRYNP